MNWLSALPEMTLAGAAMALLLFGVFLPRERARLVGWLAVLALVAAMVLVIATPATGQQAFAGLFVVDRFARFMKLLALGASALSVLLSLDYVEREHMARFEFPILMLFATLGMMLMISANDLIALYLGLELQSLPLYVIAAFQRDSLRSTEAGLKYFVLGALSSGMLLYGASMIYGFAGTTGFSGIATAVANPAGAPIGLIIGLVFLVAGLAFKVAAVPFHMWTPGRLRGRANAGDRLLLRRAEDRGHCAVRPGDGGALRCGRGGLAPDHRRHIDRLHGAGRGRRHQSAQHQAADGL